VVSLGDVRAPRGTSYSLDPPFSPEERVCADELPTFSDVQPVDQFSWSGRKYLIEVSHLCSGASDAPVAKIQRTGHHRDGAFCHAVPDRTAGHRSGLGPLHQRLAGKRPKARLWPEQGAHLCAFRLTDIMRLGRGVGLELDHLARPGSEAGLGRLEVLHWEGAGRGTRPGSIAPSVTAIYRWPSPGRCRASPRLAP
jgi:hypothetical protein